MASQWGNYKEWLGIEKMMSNQIIQFLTDERVANFIAGAALFIFLNVFDELQKRKETCPYICETKHKHVFLAKKKDE